MAACSHIWKSPRWQKWHVSECVLVSNGLYTPQCCWWSYDRGLHATLLQLGHQHSKSVRPEQPQRHRPRTHDRVPWGCRLSVLYIRRWYDPITDKLFPKVPSCTLASVWQTPVAKIFIRSSPWPGSFNSSISNVRGSLGPAKMAALNVLGREVSDIVNVWFFWYCLEKGITGLRKKCPRERMKWHIGRDTRVISQKKKKLTPCWLLPIGSIENLNRKNELSSTGFK